jgi:hypothetical protein
MSTQINRPGLAAVALLALSAGIGLAACGGASTSSTSANAAATGAAAGAPNGATGPSGPDGGHGAARFGAIRECLQKNGITLPRRPPGQGRPFGGFAGGGPRLPSGVNRAQLEAALKKCGAPPGRIEHFGRFGATERLRNPAFVQALTKFAACMRENGIDVPAPNTTGNGPVFNTSGMNTASAQFRAALAKCRSDLRRTFAPYGAGATGAG